MDTPGENLLRKTRPAEGKGLAWLLQKAEDLKHTGNSRSQETGPARMDIFFCVCLESPDLSL